MERENLRDSEVTVIVMKALEDCIIPQSRNHFTNSDSMDGGYLIFPGQDKLDDILSSDHEDER
ncbi:hypothetical protein J6590_061979 [Homalodisca vitripennis]|nr:hypothetical protein J6590_061979 [Homalodisca vitripennis]